MIENKTRGGWASGAALLLTLLLVNVAAVWGQAGWALSNIAPKIIPDDWTHAPVLAVVLACGFAMAIEGVGVFLALSADESDEAGLPAGGVRLASYAWGLFVSGGLNLSHWGIGAAGIAFASLSAISPLLWGVRARIRRGRSIAPSRRFWHPIRSVELIREMAWAGIATEEQGIAFLAARQDATPAPAPIAAEAEINPESDEFLQIAPEPVEAPVPTVERAPRAPRAPRASAPDGARAIAVRALLAGATPAAAAAESGLSVQNVRKYGQAVRALRAGAPVEVALSAGVVDMIRDEVRRSAI
jgi:hypothetical protein